MKLEFSIDCNNAAFSDEGGIFEAARLLRQTADRIEAGQDYGRLTEYNGNGCGNWSIEETEGDL